MTSMGDVADLSTTASVMLKTSIFSAWAELQCSSQRQAYLKAIVAPYLEMLGPFWLAALREYARIRTDPDASASASSGSSASTAFESAYAGLNREVALPVR